MSGGETCDTDVLNTDTGPVNLRAEFEPETINLRWYNNNTLLDTTSTNSNTCTYDTAINLPTDPVKPGYKFKGWSMRPEYDFSTIDAAINGSHRYGRGINATNNTDICWFDGGIARPCSDVMFSDINRMEWKVSFIYGTIYGMALCSSTQATNDFVMPNEQQSSGQYCWCRATGLITSNVLYAPKLNTPWIYIPEPQDEASGVCNRNCASRCGIRIISDETVRLRLFGQSNN